MKFSEKQLEQYRTEGYVIVDCPFPESLTEACMAAVEEASQDPAEGPADGSKRNHFYLRPQLEDSYWCALDHSLPFMQIILHPEIIELARQLNEDRDIYLRNGGINEQAPNRSVGMAHRRRSGLGGVHALLLRGVARERMSAHRPRQSHWAAYRSPRDGRPAQGGTGNPRFAGRRRLGRRRTRRRDFPRGRTPPANRPPCQAVSLNLAQPHAVPAGT